MYKCLIFSNAVCFISTIVFLIISYADKDKLYTKECQAKSIQAWLTISFIQFYLMQAFVFGFIKSHSLGRRKQCFYIWSFASFIFTPYMLGINIWGNLVV